MKFDNSIFKQDLHKTLINGVVDSSLISSQYIENNIEKWDPRKIDYRNYLDIARRQVNIPSGLENESPTYEYLELITSLISKTYSKQVNIITTNIRKALIFIAYISLTVESEMTYKINTINEPDVNSKELDEILNDIFTYYDLHIDVNIVEINHIGFDTFENNNLHLTSREKTFNLLDLPLGFNSRIFQKNTFVLEFYSSIPDGQYCFVPYATGEFKKLFREFESTQSSQDFRILNIINLTQISTATPISVLFLDLSKDKEYIEKIDKFKSELDKHTPPEFKNEINSEENYKNHIYFPLYFYPNNSNKFIYPPVDGIEELDFGKINNPINLNPFLFTSFEVFEFENALSLEKINYLSDDGYELIKFSEVCEVKQCTDQEIENFLNDDLNENEIFLQLVANKASGVKFHQKFINDSSKKRTKEELYKFLKGKYKLLKFNDKQSKDFYVSFLSTTKFGNLILQTTLTGTVISRIDTNKLLNSEIPIFSKTDIKQQSQLNDFITNLENIVVDLKNKKWEIREINLEKYIEDNLTLNPSKEEYNLQFIPFPIAAAFQWVNSTSNENVLLERMLKAFECVSHFYMILFYSLKDSLKDEFTEEVNSSIKKSVLRGQKELFRDLTFGKSNLIWNTISSKIKKIVKNEKIFLESGLQKFITYNSFLKLTDNNIYEIIEKAKNFRNLNSHSGAISSKELAEKIELLDTWKSDLLIELTKTWRKLDIIKPTKVEINDGIKNFEYSYLTGVSALFRSSRKKQLTNQELDLDVLYLYENNQTEVHLEPTPLIPLMFSQPIVSDNQTIYFYSKKMSEDQSRFVTYSTLSEESEINIVNKNNLNLFFEKVKNLENS